MKEINKAQRYYLENFKEKKTIEELALETGLTKLKVKKELEKIPKILVKEEKGVTVMTESQTAQEDKEREERVNRNEAFFNKYKNDVHFF